MAVGLTIFVIGLAKKVILADGIAHFVDPVFAAVGRHTTLTLFEAWGIIFDSFQINFDFSGYSDMAYPPRRLFGITLPVNFQSPYKAANIADFWRRWNITLSRFLLKYLYIPLGETGAGSP